MVAANIPLPNVRKFFIPDPGYLIVDADLTGADAQVVAWEADDEDLKAAFRAGVNVHLKNARDMFPNEVANMTDDEIKATDHPGGIYFTNKRTIHAIHYFGSSKGIAPKVKRTVSQVVAFKLKWFDLHPSIPKWHERTLRHLEGTECWNCYALSTLAGKRCTECDTSLGRTVKNAFGYRRIYFERVGDKMRREALAWTPQSTVAIVTQRGALLIEETYDFIELLLQNHDSLVFQLPLSERDALDSIRKTLNSICVPYKDPLYIPWNSKCSEISWGDCE